MIIQYCSDLHWEFPANRYWLKENPIPPEGDILIVAGDTQYLGKDFARLPLLNYFSRHFRETYLLPGNHEYYGGYDSETNLQPCKEPLRKNVWLVNNCIVEKPELRLIFTTLWSRIEKHMAPILLGVADFTRIHYRGKRISIKKYNHLHEVSRGFLESALQPEGAKKQLVVTHHLPSERCNAEEFRGSALNEAFCADLTSFIESANANAWIYGHSHRNISEFQIGNTRMLTNQLGNVAYGEHHTYQRKAIIEL